MLLLDQQRRYSINEIKFAFALGISIDLSSIGKAGLSGILLGVAVVVFTGIALVITDRLTGGDGITGLAAASTQQRCF